MLGFTSLSLVAALFSALSLIWTIPVLGVVVDSPPSFLLTTDVSPECAGINSGKYLCCAVAVQGDSELVIELSNSVGSQPPQNSVNGLQCKSLSTFMFILMANHSPALR